MPDQIDVRRVEAAGLSMTVAVAGQGPAVLLMHGFPHTWEVWAPLIPTLALHHMVIAPDLRGLGGTSRAEGGYDAGTLAADAAALLDALDVGSADVVAIDLAVPAAFLLAMTQPERVRRLAVMEALVGPLPGAEEFLRAGPPWWFGFHAVPGLAEQVLAGHEEQYLGFFLDSGTLGVGVDPGFRDAVVRAYSGVESLRCAFEHYRGLPRSGEQILAATAEDARLRVPTMTVGGAAVGAATYRQLRPLADDLVGHLLDDCGHLIPQHQPEALLRLLMPFLG